MHTTSISLLQRLHAPSDETAWQRLLDLYQPLIQHWLRRSGLQSADVDDLVQDVLGVVVRKLPEFQHDERRGSFRAWLRAITVNRVRDFWRKQGARALATGNSECLQALDQLEDPHSHLSHLWDQEHDRHVLRRLTELIEPEFKPSTWQAFRRHVMEGQAADQVAAELGLSVNAVLIAKSRVLQRLREESQGLIEDPPSLTPTP